MTQPKMITGYFLDPTNPRASGVRTIPATLDAYYALLDCSCIDIASRRIGGRRFDIVCDDEALLKDNPLVSAVDADGQPMLFGALFVVKFDGEDDVTSLTDDDIALLRSHLRHMFAHDGTRFLPVTILDRVEY